VKLLAISALSTEPATEALELVLELVFETGEVTVVDAAAIPAKRA
jgi:hypothetical protein